MKPPATTVPPMTCPESPISNAAPRVTSPGEASADHLTAVHRFGIADPEPRRFRDKPDEGSPNARAEADLFGFCVGDDVARPLRAHMERAIIKKSDARLCATLKDDHRRSKIAARSMFLRDRQTIPSRFATSCAAGVKSGAFVTTTILTGLFTLYASFARSTSSTWLSVKFTPLCECFTWMMRFGYFDRSLDIAIPSAPRSPVRGVLSGDAIPGLTTGATKRSAPLFGASSFAGLRRTSRRVTRLLPSRGSRFGQIVHQNTNTQF
jgi:hypothetical protein